MTMLKADAVRVLGGSISEAARRCRVTPQAVSGWPEELTEAIEDRVVAALVRESAPNLVEDALRLQTTPTDPQPAGQGA